MRSDHATPVSQLCASSMRHCQICQIHNLQSGERKIRTTAVPRKDFATATEGQLVALHHSSWQHRGECCHGTAVPWQTGVPAVATHLSCSMTWTPPVWSPWLPWLRVSFIKLFPQLPRLADYAGVLELRWRDLSAVVVLFLTAFGWMLIKYDQVWSTRVNLYGTPSPDLSLYQKLLFLGLILRRFDWILADHGYHCDPLRDRAAPAGMAFFWTVANADHIIHSISYFCSTILCGLNNFCVQDLPECGKTRI